MNSRSAIPVKRRRKQKSALELLRSFRQKLDALGMTEQALPLDLENEFYWLFRLEGLIAQAYQVFAELNSRHFNSLLIEPTIVYCDRASGGFYNKTQNLIGISLAMTIEFGEPEFFETLLHEIAHIPISSHSPKFYALLRAIGGTGRKAPVTLLLSAKRRVFIEKNYPITVCCPNCARQQRYKTRRALQYACKTCCMKFAGGKFDVRFKFREVITHSSD